MANGKFSAISMPSERSRLTAEQLKTFGKEQPKERAIELAAAAYNGGPESVRAHLQEGKPLSDETTQYKTKVVALWKELRGAH